jgi:hypothetical protein
MRALKMSHDKGYLAVSACWRGSLARLSLSALALGLCDSLCALSGALAADSGRSFFAV